MAISTRKYNFEYYFRRDFEYKLLSMTYQSAEVLAEEIKATGYEISWHPGHRPTHTFGGQQFTFEEMKSKGINDMLNDYNCRHYKFPVIVGVTPPKYSAEELAWLAELEKNEFEYNDADKKYTLYELSQILRKYERMIIKYERQIVYYESMGERGKNGLAKANDMLSKQKEKSRQLTELIDAIVNEHLSMMPKEEVPEVEYSIDDLFEYNWTGEYVTSEFLKKVIEISNLLKIQPDDLMAIMAFESGINPYIKNNIGATGLIQFTQIALDEIMRLNPEIKITKNDLLNMSAVEQLNYVYLHYKSYTGKMLTLSDIYMVTLWPAAVGKTDDYILWEKGGKYDRQYNQNSGLDINKDGRITKAEATQMVVNKRNYYGEK